MILRKLCDLYIADLCDRKSAGVRISGSLVNLLVIFKLLDSIGSVKSVFENIASVDEKQTQALC